MGEPAIGSTHQTNVECSDAGTCDRLTGECKCFAGYEGSACQRTTCPNECSGHGTCRSNIDFGIDFSEAVHAQQLATAEDPKKVVSPYYDYFLVTYDNAWDSDMQYGCLCDVGFRGADCSLMECPSAEDPLDEETCTKYSHGRKQERLPRKVTHFSQENGTKQPLLLKDRTIPLLSTLAKVHQLGILVRVAEHVITSLVSVPVLLVSLVQPVK